MRPGSIHPLVLSAIWVVPALVTGCSDSGSADGDDPPDATLAVLDVQGVNLDSAFESDDLEYLATVPYLTARLHISAAATDPEATVMIDGTVVSPGATVSRDLGPGSNAVAIEVANGDAQQNYTVTVERAGFEVQAWISAAPPQRDTHVGTSFDGDGAILLAGTPFDRGNARGVNSVPTDQTLSNSGAAYAFTRDSAGVWTQEAYFKASNADIGDAFGHWVAVSGDTAVVGAPSEDSAATAVDGDQNDNSAPDAGAAYVFVRGNDGQWTQTAYLKPSDTLSGDGFGYTVAIDGDTVAVSAQRTGVGVIYLFERDADGIWTQDATVGPADLAGDVGFADAIDLGGDTLAVGAKWHGNPSTGAVYLFDREGTGSWTQRQFLVASNAGQDDNFGENLALDGDTLVVGASTEASAATGINGDGGDDSAPESGAAYVFSRDDAGNWMQVAYLKSSNSESPDLFGSAVAVKDEWVAVGAENESSAASGVGGNQDDDSLPGSGAVYLFRRDTAGTWSQDAYAKAAIPLGNVRLGRGLAFTSTGLAVAAPFEDGLGGTPLDAGAIHHFE